MNMLVVTGGIAQKSFRRGRKKRTEIGTVPSFEASESDEVQALIINEVCAKTSREGLK